MSTRNQYVEFLGLDPSTKIVKAITDSYIECLDVKERVLNKLAEANLTASEASGLDVVLIKDVHEWVDFDKFNIKTTELGGYGLTYRSPCLTPTKLKKITDIMFSSSIIKNCIALIKLNREVYDAITITDLESEFSLRHMTLIGNDRLFIKDQSFACSNLEIKKIII
jgi:hypothetical protein